ncbi:hypothetical protein EW145_g5564 [Phellinidium pouzarii]|uniref:Major facilitator superfamily (MFS) profile domain-containing protein n=1 Tax=Phellinidium pouzarii TaxID=167371 RepID=A0A4S4L4A7_9AGAM|nr:hypothetical protein EW145_g5564 [Phellinidium pouzarii]
MGIPEYQNDYHHLVDTSKKWYKNRRLVVLNSWIFLLLITSMANGYDGSMMNGLQLLSQWESAFDNPSGSKLGLLGAIQNIGSLAALPFTPYLCDGLGRKWTIFVGAFIVVAGTIIQTASQSVNMFIGSRFMLGFGLGFCTAAAPMLVTEIAYPTQRAPISSVYNALWPGGAFVASWVTFGAFHISSSWAWRLPSACQAVPSVLQFFLMPWAPESPRWLISKNRDAQALQTLAYYHANGNTEDPLVQFEYEEIKAAIDAEKLQRQTGWLQLVRTPGNRRRLRIIIAIAFFSQWSGNGLISYYLNQIFKTIGITNTVEQLLINGFLNLWSLILAVLGGLFCDKIGRRPIFIYSTAGMLVCFILLTVCSSQYAIHGNKSSGDAVVAFIFLFSSAYAFAYSPLIVSYTMEILPFALRAKGYTIFAFSVSASLVFNQYINPIAFAALAWKYYIVYCAWIAFELGFVYFFLVETKNRTLEETSVIFDGNDNVARIKNKAAANAGLEGAALPDGTASEKEKEGSTQYTETPAAQTYLILPANVLLFSFPPPSIMSSSDATATVSESTKTFLTTLWVNAAVFGIEIIAFTVLRPRLKAIYEPRTYIPPEDKRSPPLSSHILAWPLSIWRSDYNEILPKNGMDAYFFVRFLRMVVKILFPIWIISWIVLLPITSVDTPSDNRTGLDKFTFGNIGSGKHPRYAAHIVLTWVFTFWIWYVIRGEMKHFVAARQRYLVSPAYAHSAQARTMLVTGVPPQFLGEHTIEMLFSHLPGGVKKVWLNRDLKELPGIYERSLAACDTLDIAKQKPRQHALKKKYPDLERGSVPMNQYYIPDLATLVPKRNRPTHRLPVGPLSFSLPLFGKKVDSIEWARKEISEAGAALERGRVVLRREAVEGTGTKSRMVAGRGIVGFVARKASICAGVAKLIGGKKRSIDTASIVTDNGADAEAEMESYPPLNSVFVLFRNQLAAHMAGQLLMHHEPYNMSERFVGVSPADVIWGNLGLNPYETKVRRVISYAATAGLVIIGVIPVTFIGLASNVAGLCTTYIWLAWLCKIPSVLLGIIQGVLPPALLIALMMLLPFLLRQLAVFEGILRRSDVELSLMTRVFIFQVLHSFLVVTFASGIFVALPRIMSNPASIPDILAKDLPSASNFFLTYVVLQGLSGTASGFLQVVPLVTYYMKLFLMGSTPRSVYTIKYTLRNVSWGTLFPSMTLIVVITLAYSVISPIINGLACFTFILFYYLYKYLFLYQFEQPAAGETGGLFFPKAIQHVFVGLYIQQICLAALFFLARDGNDKASAIPEGVLMIVLIVFTALFHVMINHSYGPLLHYLPLSLSAKANMGEKDDCMRKWSSRDTVGEAKPTQWPSRSSYAKREQPVLRTETETDEYVDMQSLGYNINADADVDLERGGEAELGEDADEDATGVFDFAHPAAVSPQRVVWIPSDALGFASGEVPGCRMAGVDASCTRAVMDAKGHVDISGPPPGEG